MELRITSIMFLLISSGVLVGCVGNDQQTAATSAIGSSLNNASKYSYKLTLKSPTSFVNGNQLTLQIASKSYPADDISCSAKELCVATFNLPRTQAHHSYQLIIQTSSGKELYNQSGILNPPLQSGSTYDFMKLPGAVTTQRNSLLSGGITSDECSTVSSALTYIGDISSGSTFRMIQAIGNTITAGPCSSSGGSGDITVLDIPDPFPLLINEVTVLNNSLSTTESSIQNITQQLQTLQQLGAQKYLNTQAANLQNAVYGASSTYNTILGYLSGADISSAQMIVTFLESNPQSRKNIETTLDSGNLVAMNAQVMAILPKLYNSSNQDQILAYQNALQTVWQSYSDGSILTASLNSEANSINNANINALLNVSKSLNNVNFVYLLAKLIASNFPKEFKFMQPVEISPQAQLTTLQQYIESTPWINDQHSLMSQQGLKATGIASINAGFGYYSDSCNIQNVDEVNQKITASCRDSTGESMPFATLAYGKCSQSNGQYRIWNSNGYLTCDDTSETATNQLYLGSQLITADSQNNQNSTGGYYLYSAYNPINMIGHVSANNITLNQFESQGNIIEMITYGLNTDDEILRCPHISTNNCEEFNNPNMVLINGVLYTPSASYYYYYGANTYFSVSSISYPAIPITGIKNRLVVASNSDYQVVNGDIMPNNIGVITNKSVTIKLGDSIQTQNVNGNNFIVVLQATDGDLAQYRCGDASCTTGWRIWSAGINTNNPSSNEYAYFSNWDGRLVVYDQVNGNVLWSSNNGVDKNGKFILHLQTDGNFYINGTDGNGISHSNQINDGPSSSWRINSLPPGNGMPPSGSYLNTDQLWWQVCKNPIFINGQLTADCPAHNYNGYAYDYATTPTLDYNSACKQGSTVSVTFTGSFYSPGGQTANLICDQPK